MVRNQPASIEDLHPVAAGAAALLARHTTAGMAVVTSPGRLRFANPALCQLLGRALPDDTGLDELVTAWSRERLQQEALPQARGSGYWQGELALSGSGRPVQWHLVAEPGEGDEVLALVHPPASPSAEACDCRPLTERLALPMAGETRFITPEAVCCIAAEGQYSRVHAGDEALLVCESISSLQGRMDHPAFLRTHRSWVVNLRRVEALVRRGEHRYLRLADGAGTEIPVSRRRLHRVRRVLGIPGTG
ncbi:LytTR family transcriptional regulator DNA-binding domain-containing protein [Thiohalospira sp.]|uniref:LytR/AlgR family response regulator transcription factor n=1 Tax=Thiohalospira sp. TaxID=3080549 RepID=UPI0039816E8A